MSTNVTSLPSPRSDWHLVVPLNGSTERGRPRDTRITGLVPSISGLLEDGTIPLALLSGDIHVIAPLPGSDIGATLTGDVVQLLLNELPVPGSDVVIESPGMTAVDLLLPKHVTAELPDGLHTLRYRVLEDGDPETSFISEALRVRIDRRPAGGELLPRIAFDESVELNGVSLQTLHVAG